MTEDPRITEIRAVLAVSAELGDEEAAVHMPRIRAMLERPAADDTAASAAFVVRDFCAERDQYVATLSQCTTADADYYRWQGHAEARRQLRERLAGTVAGPGVLS